MAQTYFGAWTKIGRLSLLTSVAVTLAACEDGKTFNPFKPKEGGTETVAPANSGTTRMTDRDVESPDVFQATDSGLWDGRPSLGGVWVAHPDVKDPERVIIRNEANGKFIIGALFRRERENPGPKIQVSSDAASALGMLAGQPARLNVTALRREEVPVEAPKPVEEPAAPVEETAPVKEPTPTAQAPGAPGVIKETALDPIASAAAAIEAADGKGPAVEQAPVPRPDAKPAQSLRKPFIQLGTFNEEAAAIEAAEKLSAAGLTTEVKEQSRKDKTFWRVLVGPAETRAERAALMKQIKGLGFSKARFAAK